MRSPISQAAPPEPLPPTRVRLDAGFRYEQAGIGRKAISAYGAVLADGGSPLDRAEAHLRMARVHRTESNWNAAVAESRAAVRLAEAGGSDDLAAEAMNVEVGVHQLRG